MSVSIREVMEQLVKLGDWVNRENTNPNLNVGLFKEIHQLTPLDAVNAVTGAMVAIMEMAGNGSAEESATDSDYSAVWLARVMAVAISEGTAKFLGFRMPDLIETALELPKISMKPDDPILRAMSFQRPTKEELEDIEIVKYRMANIMGVHPDDLAIIPKTSAGADPQKKGFLN